MQPFKNVKTIPGWWAVQKQVAGHICWPLVNSLGIGRLILERKRKERGVGGRRCTSRCRRNSHFQWKTRGLPFNTLKHFSVKDIPRETDPGAASDTIPAAALGQCFRPFPVNACTHRVKEPLNARHQNGMDTLTMCMWKERGWVIFVTLLSHLPSRGCFKISVCDWCFG